MPVLTSYSSATDGSMKTLLTEKEAQITKNRHAFLAGVGVSLEDTTLVRLTYEGSDYCRYTTITTQHKGDGMTRRPSFIADGIVVTEPNHALFLPLADCIGAVIHDPSTNILMLTHLGRHNLEQFGGTRSIEYLVRTHQVNPRHLTVWLSPAAGKDCYPLFSFDNRSLHDVATEQLLAAGIMRKHIDTSPIDSASDPTYYSHSQFLQGNRPDDGRFAVVAMMTT